uniref:Envelope glycoprotein n=1 Tax=Sarcophilus harrisii TaxID=9305 RepID=A0A7N4PJM8_SARHA
MCFLSQDDMNPYIVKILLCLLFAPAVLHGSSPYQMFNYTWVIINGAGYTVWSTSSVQSAAWWPTLYPDLCKLALGAPPNWDLEGYGPLDTPPDKTLPGARQRGLDPWGGCNHYSRRSMLCAVPFYVCPGHHRDPSLGPKCGGIGDYYCRSWGCETSGNTYWAPSSTWDFIQVTSNYPLSTAGNPGWTSIPQCVGWCHPLRIQFTDAGKKYNNWQKGVSWGLRLFKERYNDGPNTELHSGPDQGRPIQPGPPKHSPTPPLYTETGTFRPTIPIGPPSSATLILSLVNASVHTIRKISNTSLDDCWVCYSSSPPFYEGIAHFGNLTFTNDSSILRWGITDKHGLTLSRISGLGLCLLGPPMLPPLQLEGICNRTVTITTSSTYVAAPNNSYFACSSGLTTFVVTSSFISNRDYCVEVSLLPHLTIRYPDEFLRFWEQGTDHSVREKREPLTAVTLAVLIGLGAVGTGTGIASFVTSNTQYAQLSAAIDRDLQELQSGLENLKDSVASLAEVILQNRRGLDLLFLQQGGLCAALKEECCFYTDKLGLVEDSLQKVKESLEKRKKEREQKESWYQNWFSTSPWLTTLLPSLLGPLVSILLLLSFGPWAFNRLTTFIKSQVDSVLRKPVQVLYHQLNTNGSCEDLPPSMLSRDKICSVSLLFLARFSFRLGPPRSPE